MYQNEKQRSWVEREFKKKRAAPLPFHSLSSSSFYSSAPPLQEMFWGPAHILFSQCIPAGSLFMSIFPFDQSPVTTSYPPAAPVSERTHLWCRAMRLCILVRVWGFLLSSRPSLPSINMAKWFPHMVKYLCKVIWLVAEPRTSGYNLHHRWSYLHTLASLTSDTQARAPHPTSRGGVRLLLNCVCMYFSAQLALVWRKWREVHSFISTQVHPAEVTPAWLVGGVGGPVWT